MKRCGLLGEKLGHSYSPAIHAELADYEYRFTRSQPEKLGEFLTGGGFDGMNVTIPYKKAVIPYCAELSPIAPKAPERERAGQARGRHAVRRQRRRLRFCRYGQGERHCH